MVHIVNIHEAKTQLSRLIEEVERGEEVTIARAGVPCVKLVAINAPGERPMGFLRGHVPDSFFEPLPEAELAAWEGLIQSGEPDAPAP